MARVYFYRDWHFVRERADGSTDRLRLDSNFELGRIEGTGVASVEYDTEQSPQEDGVKVVNYRLSERTITLVIVHSGSSSEEERDYYIEQIYDFFRPNLYKPVSLITTYIDGRRRAITIRPEGDIDIQPDELAEGGFQITVTVIAHNPVWYNPDTVDNKNSFNISQADATSVSVTIPRVIFPITFPITFGPRGRPFSTPDLEYDGNYPTRPKIVLSGPFSGVRVENTGTLVYFSLISDVSSDESRTIEFNAESSGWEITDENGNDRRYEVSIDSNLEDFFIEPTDRLQYDQKISALFNGIATDTALDVEYQEKYISMT